MQDVAVIRWPQYAAEPTVREHVTEETSKVSSLVHKLRHVGVDSSMIDSAIGDMTAGCSAVALMSSDAEIDAVAKALGEQGGELIRSDLSIQDQDRLRAASGDSGGVPES